VLLIIANAAAVALVLMQMPGTWLMLGLTAAFTWWRWGAGSPSISVWTLVALLVLALIGEAIEFIAGSFGARKAGGSKRGAAGAIVGGVIGAVVGSFAIPVPVAGTLIGACLGAGIGSMGGDLWAGRQWREAFAAGRGAVVGKFMGTIAKVGVAVVMWLVASIAAIT
jgi:uncharacterized protein YqgC (DUF456 family)